MRSAVWIFFSQTVIYISVCTKAAFYIASFSLMLDTLIQHSKILIVDDELANVRLLELILDREGYDRVSITTDPRDVMAIVGHEQPDLVLLDLHMPYLTGYEVMELLAPLQPAEAPFPIIVLTADSTSQAKRRALTSGAIDFVCKPFDNLEVVQRIKNALRMRHLHLQLLDQNQILEERVQERAAGMEAAVAQLHTAQQQVVQQERLRALGTMSAGIAHDFNNLLSLILGYGEMLLREIPDEESRPAQYVRNIVSASQDGVEMVKRLAKFQRPASESDLRQVIHLPDLINEAIELTKPRWQGEARAHNIAISIETEFSEATEIVGDPAEFRDLLINTIFNAVDAMPNGGTITFRTRKEADTVALEIEDTGIGMSEKTRERCLEPFFTTKGARGSGLGLAMIYGITKRHQGTLDIQSKLGAGTKIQICLPSETLRPVEKPAIVSAPSAPLRVLVVDDQPLLCEILADYLHKDGHSTVTANDGEEALRKFQAERFDLVITDSAMPGMSGNELAAAVRKLRDDAMIVLLTGFAESGVSSSEMPEIDAVVGKPVVLATLRQAIAQAVALRHPPPPGERRVPTAGFLRTRPEGSLILRTIKDHFGGESRGSSHI
jgi:signal transduction histidine kinase